MKKIILTTGGFDPLHSGHIAYLKEARQLGDQLIVGLNSDEWLARKKGRRFMPFDERATILESLSCVDSVIMFDDSDNTACSAIMQVLQNKKSNETVVFANGGDRNNSTTPEYHRFGKHAEVEFAFSVGGADKKNSSSWILNDWSRPTVNRSWGEYTVLDNGCGWQVKKLLFHSGKSLSNQRHFCRSEHWHIVEGSIRMNLEHPNGDKETVTYYSGDSIDIPPTTWHQATNIDKIDAVILEVWLGEQLSEDDIERRNV